MVLHQQNSIWNVTNENDLQEPKHTKIEIVATANENVSQNLTNVDNNDNIEKISNFV